MKGTGFFGGNSLKRHPQASQDGASSFIIVRQWQHCFGI